MKPSEAIILLASERRAESVKAGGPYSLRTVPPITEFVLPALLEWLDKNAPTEPTEGGWRPPTYAELKVLSGLLPVRVEDDEHSKAVAEAALKALRDAGHPVESVSVTVAGSGIKFELKP